jgi:hypothetical protein
MAKNTNASGQAHVRSTPQKTSLMPFRPMNIHVAQGSRAETKYRSRAGLPGGETALAEALAPGFRPTRSHDLMFHMGKTIRDLTFANFYVGGQESWKASDITAIDDALAAAMSDRSLNNVMMQYFSNQPLTSTFRGSQIRPGSAPSQFTQGDVENLVRTLHAQGLFSGYSLSSTVFNVMLPSGTILNDNPAPTSVVTATPVRHAARRNPVIPEAEEADSLNGLGGYHGSIHLTQSNGSTDTVYYAVGVYSEVRPDGTRNGIPVFDLPWMNVVATLYHELNEARTDPDVEDAIRAGNDPAAITFLGWVSRQGEECGDFPVSEAHPLTKVFQEVTVSDGSRTVPVQFQYSNAVHGPEGPIAAPHTI